MRVFAVFFASGVLNKDLVHGGQFLSRYSRPHFSVFLFFISRASRIHIALAVKIAFLAVQGAVERTHSVPLVVIVVQVLVLIGGVDLV